jgi:aryl-alcohol dehydrogenase-like predicted oxidoreductase
MWDNHLTVQYRSFGHRDRVSVLGIGCGRVGSMSNPVPMREIDATLLTAVAAGVTLFDTADIYGEGDSERILRRLAARHPNRSFVVTKERALQVGVSANSIEEIEAAVAVPAVTMIHVPMAVAWALAGTDLGSRLRQRNIAVMVWRVLRNGETITRDKVRPDQAFATAAAHPLVIAAIVGVSTHAHLNYLLKSAQ